MIGRTVGDGGTFLAEQDGLKINYSARVTFTGLDETENGFGYRVIGILKRTTYDRDEQGQVVSDGVKRDRLSVNEYAFARRKSRGRLIGVSRTLEDTVEGHPLGADVHPRIVLDNGTLVLHRRGVLYDDYLGRGQTWKPRIADGTWEFSVREGKLQVKTFNRYYDVDPDTFERTPTGKTSSMVLKEIE